MIEKFTKYARVFITSGEELPEELKKYQKIVEPQNMYNVMAYISLL